MNLIAALPKQSSFSKPVEIILAGLSKFSLLRSRRRHINLGEFSVHLQRDMGFVDGRGTPGAGSGSGASSVPSRDWMV
jgi:hypothetical protein